MRYQVFRLWDTVRKNQAVIGLNLERYSITMAVWLVGHDRDRARSRPSVQVREDKCKGGKMVMTRCVSVLGLLATLSLGASTALGQTTHNVTLSGFVFTPADITVDLGDTVHWEWVSGTHNVVSGTVDGGTGTSDGNFESGLPIGVIGTTFDLVVDQAFLDASPMPGDVYPYYCDPHAGLGMVGSITIAPPIPAASDWGLVALTLLVMTAGTVVLSRGRTRHA